MQVKRKTSNIEQSQINFFESTSNDPDSDILPIIRDISSIFTLEIEYVYDVSKDLSSWLTRELSQMGYANNSLELLNIPK